jgi:hypothetical protein
MAARRFKTTSATAKSGTARAVIATATGAVMSVAAMIGSCSVRSDTSLLPELRPVQLFEIPWEDKTARSG